ncbi:MAG: glycoside hydrolase family 5 protein [Treponema sp.]|nr:glycoside hydrolase family 5 protein [Treponema sp.]
MGIVLEKYRSGINLGGWISQCSYAKEHIAGFIKKEDVESIASWGLDHVRLPFDYLVLEDDGAPFVYKEDGFGVIDRLLEWCKASSLNLVLDMHKAPGYAFGNRTEDNILFTDEAAQKRFVSLWREIAGRYKGEGDNLIFELMNEIVDPHGDTWNGIARRAIEGIREIDTARYILLGGPYYNSAAGLDTLELWNDERVLYNFHFYEPFPFTHQKASWTRLKDSGISQPYPGRVEGIEKLRELFGGEEQAGQHRFRADAVFDLAFLEKALAPAVAFAERTGRQLYCGEYGAIDLADMDSRVNWLRDVNGLFEKHGIGRAYWSYKGMSFSSVDKNGNPVSRELIDVLKISPTAQIQSKEQADV